jgi:hypothetical protein
MKTTLRRLSLGVIPAAVLAVSGVSLAQPHLPAPRRPARPRSSAPKP